VRQHNYVRACMLHVVGFYLTAQRTYRQPVPVRRWPTVAPTQVLDTSSVTQVWGLWFMVQGLRFRSL
jgi:uncharacterized membrane protein